MQIDAARIRKAFLNHVVKSLRAKGLLHDFSVPLIIDSVLIEQKAFTKALSEDKKRALSLSSLQQYQVFDADGMLDHAKLSAEKITVSTSFLSVLQEKTFGDISDYHAIILETLIQQYYQQLMAQITPKLAKISEMAQQKGSQEAATYSDLKQSIDAIVKNICSEVRSHLADNLQFEVSNTSSLNLTKYSQKMLEGGIEQLGGANSNLFYLLPEVGDSQHFLSASRLKSLLSETDNPLNILNLEHVNLQGEQQGYNYFMPNSAGQVVLPKVFAPLTATSTLVGVVGRIQTYQVRLSSGKILEVDHLPVTPDTKMVLSQQESSYLKKKRELAVNRCIHGAHATPILAEAAFCLMSNNQEQAEGTLGASIEHSRKQEIEQLSPDSKPSEVDYALRLWREFLQFEIEMTQKKLSIGSSSVWAEHLAALNDLLKQTSQNIIPNVTQLSTDKRFTKPVSTFSNKWELATRLLSGRLSPTKIVDNELRWLVDVLLEYRTEDESLPFEKLLDFGKSNDVLISSYYQLLLIEAAVAKIKLGDDNSLRLTHDFPQRVFTIANILEGLALDNETTPKQTTILKKLAGQIISTSDCLMKKLASQDARAVEQAQGFLIYAKRTSTELEMLFESDMSNALKDYTLVHHLHSKISACLDQAAQEKLEPKKWLLALMLTESERAIAPNAVLALEPFTSFIEKLQAETAFVEQDYDEAVLLLNKGISDLKQAIVANNTAIKVPTDNPRRQWLLTEAVTTELINSVRIAEPSKQAIKEDSVATAYELAMRASQKRQQELEQTDLSIKKYQKFEDYLLSTIAELEQQIANEATELDLLRKIYQEQQSGELELMPWLLDAPIRKNVLQQKTFSPLFLELDQIAEAYNTTEQLPEKQKLIEQYKVKLNDVLLTVEVQEEQNARYQEMAQVISKSKLDGSVNKYQSGTSYAQEVVAKKIPQVIFINIDLLLEDSNGQLSDPLFIEWLKVAYRASAHIVLVADNPRSFNKLQSYKVDLAAKGVLLDDVIGLSDKQQAGVRSENLSLLLEQQLSTVYANVSRSDCLFIDRKRKIELNSELGIAIEKIRVDKKLMDKTAHDNLLHKLAYKYDYLAGFISYFTGQASKVPISLPFGYQTEGFNNSWLVKTTSIRQFQQRLEQWVKALLGINRAEQADNVLLARSKDQLKLKRHFNSKGINLDESQLESLLHFPVIDGEKYFAMRRDRQFLANYSNIVHSDIFNETFEQIDSKLFMEIAYKTYTAYQNGASSIDNFEIWCIDFLSEELALQNQLAVNVSKKRQRDLQAQLEMFSQQFMQNAIKAHKEIADVDVERAREDQQVCAQYLLKQTQELLKIFNEFMRVPALSKQDIELNYRKLSSTLNLMELYFANGLEVNKEMIEVAYNKLYAYRMIYFANGCDVLLKGDDFRADFIKNYRTLSEQIFPESHQVIAPAQILKEKQAIVAPIQQDICIDFDKKFQEDGKGGFFSLVESSYEADFNAKSELALEAFRGIRGRLMLYNQNINSHDLDGAVELLDVCTALTQKAVTEKQSLISVVLFNWDDIWDKNFKENLLMISLSLIEKRIAEFEQRFINAKYPEVRNKKPTREELQELSNLIDLFHQRFGASLLEVRFARLKALAPQNPKSIKLQVDPGLGLTLESDREALFLRQYFSDLSPQDIARQVRPELAQLFSSSAMVNANVRDIKEKYEQQLIMPYLRLLFADTLQLFKVERIPQEDSIESVLAFIGDKAQEQLFKPCSVEQLAKTHDLMLRVVKYSTLYSNLYYDNQIVYSPEIEALPQVLEQVSQAYAKAYLEQLRTQIKAQTKSGGWQFSWAERHLWGSQEAIQLDGQTYFLPKKVKAQYQRIDQFLEQEADNPLNYAKFKEKELSKSKKISASLSTSRATDYLGFFKDKAMVKPTEAQLSTAKVDATIHL